MASTERPAIVWRNALKFLGLYRAGNYTVELELPKELRQFPSFRDELAMGNVSSSGRAIEEVGRVYGDLTFTNH